MKKILFSIFGLLLSGLIFGQQHPSYTQYTLNQFALNPAVAGLKKCPQTSFGTRRQWSGFEGAPEHVFASFNTRLNKADQFPKNFHGIGAYISNDRMGFSNYSMLKISYAFHLKMSRNYHFSAGIFAGVHYQKTGFNNLRIRDRSNDPAIISQEGSSIIFPEVSPGVFIHNNKFFAGLSMFQQYPTRIKEVGTKENRLAAHYFLMTGYKIKGEVLNYTPSMLVSFAAFAPPTVDLTLTADYKNKISIALGSKYLNSAYTTVQLNIGGGVKMGYSYEYALTELVRVAPSTHELVLQFSSCHVDKNKIKVVCPAYQ
ncbi:PorP/SprF family type IX secretion system membrane protein [Vicingaceae bacterium]|nr:PorP/SprF family type IX secretion system membrane protein [Vicingaceae bacterium]MDC1452035.1 PorP/SprF family type IX secretion system membrane protein [Vicingaceae bacterium]